MQRIFRAKKNEDPPPSITDSTERVVSHIDLSRVHDLIERCLQLYMSRNETIDTLNLQARIEPAFTEIVWQKLEQENQEFFKAYNLRLMLKDQITHFNSLLEIQYGLMCQTRPAEVAPVPRLNRSHVPPLPFDSGSYAPFQSKPIVPDELPNTFFDADVSQNTPLAQNSNFGVIQRMNGLTVGSHVGHAGNTHMPTNVMPSLQGASVSSTQQILRNLSLSDFTDDFGDNCFDMMFDNGFGQGDFGSV